MWISRDLLMVSFLVAAALEVGTQAAEPKEKEFTSQTTGMKFVRVPKGTFIMGSPETEMNRFEDEQQHEVTLSRDFYLGMYEVKRGEFRKFVDDTGYKTEAETGDGSYGWGELEKVPFGKRKELTWQNAGFAQIDEHPVVNVSWNDATRFAVWLSNKDGQEYRLPTEAEWEYACRAGSSVRYSFGDKPEDLVKHANMADGTARRAFPNRATIAPEDGYVWTAPVGRYSPNAFGVYDMHGNVSEWCADWMGDYPVLSVTDPTGPPSGSVRVYRGGGWVSPIGVCRAADRNAYDPSFRINELGFRLVREVTAKRTGDTPL